MALSVGLLTLTAPFDRVATIVQFSDSATFCQVRGQDEAHQVSWPEESDVARPFAPLLWHWAGVAGGRETDPPLTATLTMLAGPPDVACTVAFDTQGCSAKLGPGGQVSSVAELFATCQRQRAAGPREQAA